MRRSQPINREASPSQGRGIIVISEMLAAYSKGLYSSADGQPDPRPDQRLAIRDQSLWARVLRPVSRVQ